MPHRRPIRPVFEGPGERFREAVRTALHGVPDLPPELRDAVEQALRAPIDALEHELSQAERFALIGRMAATLAHELRNPLSVIETSAFILAERGREDPRVERHTRRINEQVAQASALVTDLLDAVRERPVQGARADIPAVARAAVAQVPCPVGSTVVLKVPAELPPAWADERRVRQVIVNLVQNALESMPEGVRVEIQAFVRDDDVVLAVTDNGPGIPDAQRRPIFDPLFTTKPRGTGLGLPLSRAIARAHGGDLVLVDGPAGGARFELILPLAHGVP